MSLRERIQGNLTRDGVLLGEKSLLDERAQGAANLRALLHERLLKTIDLSAVDRMVDSELKVYLKSCIQKIVADDKIVIGEDNLAHLVYEIQNEIIGLGPIEPLISDPTISDILVNNYKTIFVERKGRLERTNVQFDNDAHLLKVIEKIVERVGRRIDESSPMVDARLPDGSRVNAIIPPLALDGPALSIRRFSEIPLSVNNLIEYGSLTSDMALIIGALVKVKTNILISGGTGSGKTTLLNVMSGYIPDNERIITIEDAAELRLQQPHVVRLETRPPNIEGKGEVSQRALVKNTLRMRPDRIIVGEVRGIEVIDMLQAMNTGHEGSLTTIHANTARDALTRLENMVGLAGVNVMQKALREQIVSGISVIIQVARLSDGRRKIMSIQEITGMEGEVITMQEIFCFEQTGVAPDGSVLGHFRATGIRPRFADRLQARGAPLADYLFDPSRIKER
ncbi:CpaF family protein [Polynucleobacter sp. AP-Reno-20A-A9]|uniref:CpaF family protein n=1 Tax=Polynucleobacter sp. AP-Reno-20A-A9 TaxID=2576925 RepID=UPI001C0E8A1B|nr:CpaF family protein [Polynucleobacter sp. AP-Reno-20A-A9]MBU3628868.1 CpaF family protein [Polynucleobacter sp. AP-Reno-20A-A9]